MGLGGVGYMGGSIAMYLYIFDILKWNVFELHYDPLMKFNVKKQYTLDGISMISGICM